MIVMLHATSYAYVGVLCSKTVMLKNTYLRVNVVSFLCRHLKEI